MKNLKQKPVLYGIVNALGTLIAAVLIWWIFCMISKEPFPDSLLKLPTLIIYAAATVFAGVQAYFKAKNKK